ncbi:MAG TPA: transglutaminase family protein [Gemmataceae bacterium]|nr:transglutaminase family protein [Gemmataceae bacterium]
MTDYRQLLACTDEELARVDPLVLNLLVAKSIPSLADLDLPRYQRQADQWAEDVRQRLPAAEAVFRQTPWEWKNDINFFRLGVLCGYLEYEAGIAYNEDQRDGGPVFYTDPSDLFLNGVMDRRRGTCGNMAALHVAIGWRLGWSVSLACVKSHFVCRYDDGKVTHNIEATQAGYGGFKSDPDDYLIRQYGLPPVAIRSGSDLRALKPREMLGVFLGFRGRHMRDTGRWEEAEADYLLARWLFPNSRHLYIDAMALAVPRGAALFEPGELGSPQSLAEAITEQYGSGPAWATPADLAIRDVVFTRINS